MAGLGSSGGICSFQVRCEKDHFRDDEVIKVSAKLDNSRSRQPVSKVEVRLLRFIRLHTHQLTASNSGYDLVLTQELTKSKHGGVAARVRDNCFHREFLIDLGQVFSEDEEILAPSAFGKTFMIHYGVEVSLKHPGIFSQATQLEVDVNIDSSKIRLQT